MNKTKTHKNTQLEMLLLLYLQYSIFFGHLDVQLQLQA